MDNNRKTLTVVQMEELVSLCSLGHELDDLDIDDIAQGIRDMWRIKPEDIGKIQAAVQYHFDKLPVPQKRIARKYMQKEMESHNDTAITSESLAE